MKHYLLIALLLAGSFTAAYAARSCALEGEQTARDILREMPSLTKEEKLQECASRGTFFESKVTSCIPGTFETACKALIENPQGDDQ